MDGNFARRDHPVQISEYTVWDLELVGFGLRVRPTGKAYWTVRLQHRGKQRRVTIGRTEDVGAVFARAQARRLLAEVALDGLPKRKVVKAGPTLTTLVDSYWTDIARYWKERYFSPLEYRRLAAALRAVEAKASAQVAIIRLLLYTGARISEIRDLRWEWVHPSRLTLPNSKNWLQDDMAE